MRSYVPARALTLAAFLVSGVSGGASAGTVEGSVLFDHLWGFGGATTGGLDGQIYIVDSVSDSGDPGTLRHAVEGLAAPVWIVFDPAVFPPATRTVITLESPLSFAFRNDVTIDGRGSHVSLERVMSGPCSGVGGGEVVKIRSSENIILTHLEFSRVYADADPLDKESCGDIIQIYNSPSQTGAPGIHYDRVWINQCSFSDCGDECIGITRFNAFQRAHLTVSRNEFIGVSSEHEKGMLMGLDSHEVVDFGVAVSLFRNRFYNLKKRLPRVSHGYLRAYNNVFENWETYGLLASEKTRLMIEQNVFRSSSSSLKDDAWETNGTNDNDIWARDNTFWTTSGTCPLPPGGTGSCTTASFPACSNQGGPWYYDCSDPVIDITDWSYAVALDFLRSLAGWRDEANDVLATVGIEHAPAAPTHPVALLEPTPNPFRATTTLRFRLGSSGNATIRVFTVTGRLVHAMALHDLSAGEHAVDWSATDSPGSTLPGGVYFVRIEANGAIDTARAIRAD